MFVKAESQGAVDEMSQHTDSKMGSDMLSSPYIHQDLWISTEYVIPLKTGIQEVIDNTGFRLPPEWRWGSWYGKIQVSHRGNLYERFDVPEGRFDNHLFSVWGNGVLWGNLNPWEFCSVWLVTSNQKASKRTAFFTAS